MTALREAAQAVLDACTYAVAGWESLAPLAVRIAALESLAGLRAALEQQAEQKPCSTDPRAPHGFDRTASHTAGRYVCECQHWQAERFCDTHCTWADHAAGCVRAEPVQEPVAIADGTFNHDCPIGTLLYTAPPQRKPLTDEETLEMAEKAWKPSIYYDAEALLGTDGLVALVRAVEAKHGIKE